MKTVGVLLSIFFLDCLIESSGTVDDKETTGEIREWDSKEESKDSLKHFLEKYPSGPESFSDVIDKRDPIPIIDTPEDFQSYGDFTYQSYDYDINSSKENEPENHIETKSSSNKFGLKLIEKLVDSDSGQKLVDSDSNQKLVDSDSSQKLVDSDLSEKLVDSDLSEKLVDFSYTDVASESENSKKVLNKDIFKTKVHNRFYDGPERFDIIPHEKNTFAKNDQYDSRYDYESYLNVKEGKETNTEDGVDSTNTYQYDTVIPDVDHPDDISIANPQQVGITTDISTSLNTTHNTRISELSSMESNTPEKFNRFEPEKFNSESNKTFTSQIMENYQYPSEPFPEDEMNDNFNSKTFRIRNPNKKVAFDLQAPENFRATASNRHDSSLHMNSSYFENSENRSDPISGISFLQKNKKVKTTSEGINENEEDDFENGTDDKMFIEITKDSQVDLSKNLEQQINHKRKKIKIKPNEDLFPLSKPIRISEGKEEVNRHILGKPAPKPIQLSEDAPHYLMHEFKSEEIKTFQRHPFINLNQSTEKVLDKNIPSALDSLKYIFSNPKRFFSLINNNENLREAFEIPEQLNAEIPEGFIRDSSDDLNYTDMWLRILKTIYQIIKTKSVLEGTETTDLILNDLLNFLGDIESYVEHFHDEIGYPYPYHRVSHIFPPRGNLCLALDFLDSFLDFHEARLFCQIVKGGDLVIFRDAKEFAYIQFFLRKIDPLRDFSYWIGLTDEDKEGDWRFLDGRTARYGAPFWGVKKMYCPMCKNPNPLLIKEIHDESSYPYYRILQPEIMNKHENYAILMKQDHHYIHDVSMHQAEKLNTIPLCQYVPERDDLEDEGPDIYNELMNSLDVQPYYQ